MNARMLLVASVFPFLVACAESLVVPVDGTGDYSPSVGPLLGAADSTDSADHDCRIVLWEIGRRSNQTGGYLDNGYNWIWFGQVDVAQEVLEQGGVPAVLFRTSMSRSWWETAATPVDGAAGGFQRFEFRLDRDTPTSGMSGTSLTRSTIEVIPFLRTREGGRLFDHNRNPDDFANYLLDSSNGWAIQASTSVCSANGRPTGTGNGGNEGLGRPSATLSFTDSWQVDRTGRIVEGGTITIQYDIDRLSQCRATHNGYPSWDLRAHVRFAPSGEELDASVRAFETHYGTPTSSAYDLPATFDIPVGTTSMAVWFHNVAMTGGEPCQAWDSNYGDNYIFDVIARPAWLGNAVQKISRAGGHPCDGGSALESSFEYGSWPRTRAVVRNVCFEAYQAGVTDRSNPDLWQDLDVQVHWRFGDAPFSNQYLELVDQPGNNARYVFDIGGLDPFRPTWCSDVSTTVTTTPSGEQREQALMEFFFTVNGAPLRPTNGDRYFVGEYWDYYSPSGWRAENCQ